MVKRVIRFKIYRNRNFIVIDKLKKMEKVLNELCDIIEPPAIIPKLSSPEKVIVREGDTIQLVCNVTGVPTPTVRWYKKSYNGRPYSYNNKESTLLVLVC